MFDYRWKISDGYPSHGIQKNGMKVFGTFICGGGSSMGYKLTGYDHMGGVEIDKQMAGIYEKNHNPKYMFNEDIRNFVDRNDIPDELYNIDVLDGSPPCSSFSMSGSREKGWGKKKKFREGQSEQVLDDLFFYYIALAKKLKPKVVIAENVKGMLAGNARSYVKKIKDGFVDAGYRVQLFLLDASTMGVPQRRQRVFFVCIRDDIEGRLSLIFNERKIPFREIENINSNRDGLSSSYMDRYNNTKAGANPKTGSGNTFGFMHRCDYSSVVPTITAGGTMCHPVIPKELSDEEIILAGSFPSDYNFMNADVQYVIGMSVPPVMMAHVSHQIYEQVLKHV